MIKTTASAKSWDEWAAFNDIKVVNVPVGFKEIANIMKKVEKQIIDNPEKDVIVTDVFNREVNLGKNPRMIFGGEESGGMIIGSEELIKSKAGRIQNSAILRLRRFLLPETVRQSACPLLRPLCVPDTLHNSGLNRSNPFPAGCCAAYCTPPR